MKTRKIKILYTIPNFDTAGSGKVVYDLVKNLDRTIFEPEICCFHNKGAFFNLIKELGVKIHLFPFAISYRPFITFPFRLLKLISFFKKHKFDIIHSWHWSSDFSEPLAAKIANIPYIYTKKAMGWGNRAWKWRSQLSSKIIVINSDMIPLFFTDMRGKAVEIPLGVDTDYYYPQTKKRCTPENLCFDTNDFVIVAVVNLIKKKGIEILIQAVNDISDDTIKVCIVGNDNNSEYANMLKGMAKINKNIYFLGEKLDVRPYHAISDLFVIPTNLIAEGLPIAPLEAMASGKIVIGSNVSGVKDILEKFPSCIFEPNNIERLKETILKIKSLTPEEHKELEKEMRLHVETNYSLKNFVTKNAELYKEITS